MCLCSTLTGWSTAILEPTSLATTSTDSGRTQINGWIQKCMQWRSCWWKIQRSNLSSTFTAIQRNLTASSTPANNKIHSVRNYFPSLWAGTLYSKSRAAPMVWQKINFRPPELSSEGKVWAISTHLKHPFTVTALRMNTTDSNPNIMTLLGKLFFKHSNNCISPNPKSCKNIKMLLLE